MHKFHKYFALIAIIALAIISLGALEKSKDKQEANRITANDDYEYIAVNQCFMWVANNGDGSHDPRTDASGFYWPGGVNATIPAIFEDGLIFGGKIGSEVRVNGNTHRQGLQAGKILANGTPDSPAKKNANGNDQYRVYKIRKDWESLPAGTERDAYELDYNEWPVEDGAPWVDVDGDGKFTRGVDTPEFVGDEVLWYVANDMDAARSTFTYGTNPMGLEFQTTIFGFNRTGDLGDMVFKKYLIINKGNNTIDSMTVAYWSDTDLGNANDDYTGCDTVLSLGYTWNGDNNDESGGYGPNPPAIGYDFFQGPIVPGGPDDVAKFKGGFREGYKNLPMTAFTFYINIAGTIYRDPQQGVAEGSVEFFRYLNGRIWNGTPFVDPHTGDVTKFILAGDPVAGTGWYEGAGWPGGPAPSDRRHVMASGPFTMAPGDTQEVVVAIIVGRSSNNVKSIKELKIKDLAAQFAYDVDFELPDSPPAPSVTALPQDGEITLWWETNSESYENDYYEFEGYRIWQFRDLSGTEPVVVDIYDLANDVGVIEDYVNVNGERILAPVILGNNTGLIRTLTLSQNIYTNGNLFNANPYYIAVTAYGVAKRDDITPSFLESVPQIIEVMPGERAIDDNYGAEFGDTLANVSHTQGTGSARVYIETIDPTSLTGDTYKISFDSVVVNDTTILLGYNLNNTNTGDVLISNFTDLQPVSTVGFPVVEGFKPIVLDWASIRFASLGAAVLYGIEDIFEVNGPGGTPLSEPVSVFAKDNSTGQWQIDTSGNHGNFALEGRFATDNGLGFNTYEIRFTGSSPFYSSGYQFGANTSTIVVKSDTVSANTVPFEVWNLGTDINSTDDDTRLAIKILDNVRDDLTLATPDDQWSQLPSGKWETIFAFDPEDAYPPDQLPELSGRLDFAQFKLSFVTIMGDRPADGTVIRFNTLKRLSSTDEFEFTVPQSNFNDKALAKNKVDEISVFPNPYFGANNLETNKYARFQRFTGLPKQATIRIYSLSGVFITRIDKDDNGQYVDWNLLNQDGLPVASGVYLAYIDMPGVGTKVLKLAIVQEQQYIDRL